MSKLPSPGQAVFKGRVAQQGDNLDVSAELIDARDNSHIWGQQYDRKLADVIVLREEIAREITTALRVRLSGDDTKRMVKNYTANPEAYQLYLQGRFWWNKQTEDGLNKGIEYFQQAIQKDPTYALAYTGLADCNVSLAADGFVAPKEAFPKGKDSALKALEIDESLAEAHTSVGAVKTYYEWDWSGAIEEFQRAIGLNPAYAMAHWRYGIALVHTGRVEQAVAEEKRALELDPLSLSVNFGLGQAFFAATQYDQAIEQLQRTLELDPNFILARPALAFAYVQKSMYKEAIAESEKALAISPGNATALSNLGYTYAVEGRSVDAQKVLNELAELSKRKYVPAIRIAPIYAGLGERDVAFMWLEKSYEDRSIGTIFTTINVDPRFDPLRSDPRFQDLLRRMNLQP